uniref:Uncharacterized protein n=1 Tax=Aegilops tauschii subsp. strangulata TaxID=200361 RepID=A0A453JGB1_AEGTS
MGMQEEQRVPPPQARTVIDEVCPDVLRSAVMNVPGFPAEALRVALSHLENTYQVSAYLRMQEEQRVLWLRSFLAKGTE